MKRKVISRTQIQTKLPYSLTISIIVLLKTFEAPGWLCGACSAILIAIWIGAIKAKFVEEEPIDIFKK